MEKANEEAAQRFAHDIARRAADAYKTVLDPAVLQQVENDLELAILTGVRWAASEQAQGHDVSVLQGLAALLEEPEDPDAPAADA